MKIAEHVENAKDLLLVFFKSRIVNNNCRTTSDKIQSLKRS